MPDYTSYKAAYDRDGFVLVRNFLPSDELEDLTAQVNRYIRNVVPTLPDQAAFYQDKDRPETLKQLQKMGDYDAFFSDYRDQPRWKALAQTLIGEAAQVSQPEWFNKPPQTEHPTPPHQDNFYFNLTPPNVASIWLALDPVDEGNGCLRYSLGSHHKGIRPHTAPGAGFSQGIADYGPQDQAHEVAVHLQPGDAVVHHGEVIHRADPIARRSAIAALLPWSSKASVARWMRKAGADTKSPCKTSIRTWAGDLCYIMRVLITGGAGFLGSHLSDLLLEKGCEIICMDNLLTGRPVNIAHLLGHPPVPVCSTRCHQLHPRRRPA